MRLIILLLTSLLYETPSFTCVKIEVQKNNRDTAKRFSQPSKRQDDLGYLEQCSILQFWDKQIGRVNVLAFFDSSWPFSHRQAAMLKVLRERFDKTGFENIQFLAINAAAGESDYVSRAEIEVEEETWKQISPSEAEGVPAVVPSAEALASALGSDVYFIQDSSELQIWSKLRAFRDQILVIDRCGRLTYQVIVPWSILHFPYVKAAILSTYKDEPCGHCEYEQLFDYSTESGDITEEPSTLPSQAEESDARALSQVEESTTIGTGRTEGGNNTSELLFSQSGDDYDTQTVADDSSTLTPPIDANDTTPTSTLRENSDDATDETSPLADHTDNIYAEYSTYTSQNDYLDSTDQSRNSSIVNRTSVDEYDSTTFYFRDQDFPNDNESNFTTSTIDFETTTETGDVDKSTIYVDEAVDNSSEKLNLATESPSARDAGNSSESIGERRLTDREEIEKLEARDVLKSRSTNARSVSPNDGSDNQLIQIRSEAGKEESQLEADYLIPIRIIMRAPHVDEYSDRSLKAHEYLVLKTGQPTYHEHLDANQEHEHEHEPVRKRSEAVKSTFARDESPGLYGELADYWQHYGNEQTNDHAGDTSSSSSGSFDDDDHEQVLQQQQSFAQGSHNLKSTTILNDHANPPQSDNQQLYDDHSTSYEDADVIDEEAKSKLIAHYSKLLPWLYYVLAK